MTETHTSKNSVKCIYASSMDGKRIFLSFVTDAGETKYILSEDEAEQLIEAVASRVGSNFRRTTKVELNQS